MRYFRLMVLSVMTVVLALPAASWAEPIKITAQQPLTGRFAFAGKHIHQGLADCLAWTNEQGGVNGTIIEYLFEDTGYDLQRAIASFKKMMAKEKPVMNYGESTGEGKALAPEINSHYQVVYGSTSFSSELA